MPRKLHAFGRVHAWIPLAHTVGLVAATSIVPAQAASPNTPSSPSQPLIILIGPPLSGKATFAESISQTYRIPYISIEDLIRATVLNG